MRRDKYLFGITRVPQVRRYGRPLLPHFDFDSAREEYNRKFQEEKKPEFEKVSDIDQDYGQLPFYIRKLKRRASNLLEDPEDRPRLCVDGADDKKKIKQELEEILAKRQAELENWYPVESKDGSMVHAYSTNLRNSRTNSWRM